MLLSTDKRFTYREFSVDHRWPAGVLFFLAAALVKEKTSRHRQEAKKMKFEEVNLKTKKAVDYLVQSLESGHSAVLTQHLGAMARFRNYSFGNIMLMARLRAGT
jgi:hypothetical protein